MDVNAVLLDGYLKAAVNRSLQIGGLVSAGLGVVGGGGIALFMLITGTTFLMLPCAFSFVGAAGSLVIWRVARARLFHGPMDYVAVSLLASLPTLFFLASHFLMPAGAATFYMGPFAYLYSFFVVISGFLFNVRLTLYCGALAAAESFAVFMLAAPRLAMIDAHDDVLQMEFTSPFIFANRSLMIMATAFGAAGIAEIGKRLVRRILEEKTEKQRIGGLFGQYVSPEVKERIISQKGGVVGERKEVVVLFCDLRGFSTFSEGRDPKEVVERLNAYFDGMVRAIESEGGVVDKFIGDAVMAVFGGLLELPNPAASAVRASKAMRFALLELNGHWARAGVAPFDNGIGLHIGDVIQGPLGSERRKEFTVIGDAVNTASRLESMTKEKGACLLVTRALYERLPPVERAWLTPFGETLVKGKAEVLGLYGAGKETFPSLA
jgi:class 3 adenylate cyclase